MKKLLLIFLLSAIAMTGAKAQIGGGYNFAMNFGGGGFEVQTTNVDASNNTYFSAQVAGIAKFAGQDVGATSTTSFPILTNFIGKISANGTQTFIKSFGKYPPLKSVFSPDGDFYGIFKGDKNNPVDLGINVMLDDWGLYLVKINATGVFQFVKKITVGIGALQAYQPINVSGMQVTADGNLYFGAQSLTYADSGSPYPSAKFPSLIAKYDANGNAVWSKTYYGDSRAFINMGQQFVSNDGKVSFGIRAQSGDPFYMDGVNITSEMSAFITQYTSDLSIVISLNADGTKNFGIADGVSPVSFIGVNPFTGNINLQYSYLVQPGVFEQRLPSKAPFTSLPDQGIAPIKAFSGILTFNSAGAYLGYKSGVAISDNSLIATSNGFVNYLNYSANNSVDLGNGYAFGDTKPFAVVSYYDQNFNFLKAVKSSKINSIGANGNIVSFGGTLSTDYTFGNTTLIKNYNDPAFASNPGTYYQAYKNDLYIAQADATNVVAPAPVTWLGVDYNWDNTANWSDNKVPNVGTLVKFDANTTAMPTTGTNPKALGVTIDAGVTAQLPANLSISGGKLIINGKLQINHTGNLSFANYNANAFEGTGTLEFKGTAPATVTTYSFTGYKDLTLETNDNLNFSAASSYKKIKFTGTGSVLKFGSLDVTSTDEDAITGYSATNFIEGGLTRAVNPSGTYVFPGRPLNLTYEPATLTLNSFQGITKIKAEFKGAVGAPNYKFPDGSTCTNVLGSGYYGNSVKFSADAVPTSGTYDITLQRSAFTNGVLDANKEKYVILTDGKFQGIKLASTQDNSGTTSGQTVSNALVTAGISGLSKFGEFLIGVNSAIVPVGTAVTNATWAGATSGDWNLGSNWSSGVVPNGLTNVIIPVVTRYPSIYGATDFVNSLTINNGVLDMSLSHTLGTNLGITNNGDVKIEKLGGATTVYSGAIQGTGKTRFESNSGLTAISMATSNNVEVNIGNTNSLEVTGAFSGNFNVKSGIITSQYSSNPFEITNPNAIVQITNPLNGISTDQYIQTVNTTGTYFFPLISSFRNQSSPYQRNYGAITIKNNGISAATKYNAKFEVAFKVAVSTLNGSDFYNDFLNSGQWYITPSAVSATGTIDVSFTTSGYTNGRTNIADYVLLRRASNSQYENGIPWIVISGATITENAGTLTASANGIPAISTVGVTFCIGLKAGITTWTGIKNNMNWNDAGNWTNNDLPSATLKAVIGNASNYPNNPPTSSTNQPAVIEIASGSVVSFPATFSAPKGIVNNGSIKIVGASNSTFTGFLYNSSPVNISGSGKLVFDANSPSTFDSYFMGYTIGNGIEVNSPSGLNLNRTTTFTGDVNLVNGKITMGSGQVFTMNNPNATLSGNANAYIIGQLNRKVNPSGTYNFPVGITGAYAPVSLNLNGLTTTTDIVASFSDASNSQPNLTIGTGTVTSLLPGGAWTISPTPATIVGNYSVTLNAPLGSSSATDFYVLKRPATYYSWENLGTNVASSTTAGVVTASVTGLTSFSQFGIGEGFGVLPVTLTKFTASADAKTAKLYWATASELNNDKFEIERSTNGIDFVKVGEVKGNGTSQKLNTYSFKDYAPTTGVNYYRLKQLDFNGDFDYSEVRAVNFDFEAPAFTVFPNPTTDVINFNKAVNTVEIYNLQGTLLLQRSGILSSVKIPNNLGAGLYLLKLKLADGSVTTKQIIVNR